MIFRKADRADLDAVEAIYHRIHEQEKLGSIRTGWIEDVYPVRATAEAALARGDLFVCEEDGAVRASAIVNQTQVDVYAEGGWLYPADDSRVMVLHTLTVDPEACSRGIGRAFVAFYEQRARDAGCAVLRMDTNVINGRARRLYAALGFREAGTVPCVFNGIPGVRLVLLEKRL